jgi:hypothetical protein
MSKATIARKGWKFVNAHNARIERATKGLRRALTRKHSESMQALMLHGLHHPVTSAAREEEKRADRVLRAAQARLGYITPSDRVLIAVFGK